MNLKILINDLEERTKLSLNYLMIFQNYPYVQGDLWAPKMVLLEQKSGLFVNVAQYLSHYAEIRLINWTKYIKLTLHKTFD